MESNRLESLVENLFLFLPLIKKKLINPDLFKTQMDLTPSHLQVLFILSEVGTMTASNLASFLKISKSNLTPLLKKLTEKKLIKKVSSVIDKRYSELDLTDSGLEFISEHKKAVLDDLRHKISGFSDSDLDKLAEAVEVIKGILIRMD